MTTAVLALGANLGDPRSALAAAVVGLSTHPGIEVRSVSGLWRTAPVGGPEQPDYLNAVVVVDTTLAPDALLDAAQDLETAAGRRRDVRWGPRTLDVDIIDIEGIRSDDPRLTLPHPRARERAFVLAPWHQADPGARLSHDGVERSIEEILATLADQAVEPVEEGGWWR